MRLGKWSSFAVVLSLWCAVFGHAQAPAAGAEVQRDTLVYKDGDRVHGTLVEQTATTIVFRSERFGELRVAVADAVVIKAAPQPAEAPAKQVVAQGIRPAAEPATAAQTAEQAAEKAEQRAEEEKARAWDLFSPAVLTAKVRQFFGPWGGRIAFSNELLTDAAERQNVAFDVKLSRKFKRDSVDLNARYDYNQTDEVVTMDVFKGGGSWRHDFPKNRMFSQYRPTVEWNRVNIKKRAEGEYTLVQQEIGFGVNLWTKPTRKVRVGVSENLFDIWSEGQGHGSRAVASLFDEVEIALPWRMKLTQRGVWYPETEKSWENQVELNKKLTETLSLALRQEIRRNNPDGASLDYTRLRLLIGLDF